MEGRTGELKMNLVDLAIRRVGHYKEEWKGNYVNTTYIAIDESNHIKGSLDPSVLGNAKRCILLHERSEVDFYTGHPNYTFFRDVDYVNEDGEVFKECLDKDFKLYVIQYAYEHTPKLYLTSDGICYTCCPSWRNTASIVESFRSVWNLYNELKSVETKDERATIVRLYKNDEKILQQKKEIVNFSYANALLEKERDMYKGLLDDIKGLLLK